MAQGQNRNVLQPGQMQNSASSISSQPNVISRDSLGRHDMLNRVCAWLQQRQPSLTDEASKAKLFEVAKRLEIALLKAAKSKEEYLDFRSFDVRIESILKQLSSQRRANPSSSVSAMVQTSGGSLGCGQSYTATPMVNMSTVNSNNYLSAATIETGRLLPTNRMNGGSINNGCQQLSAVGQMIPSHGFDNSISTDVYQSHRIEEYFRDGGKLQASGSDFGNPSPMQRQRPTGLNDRMIYNLDHQLGGGFRSNIHQNTSGMTNIPLNAGVGMSGNNVHLANGARSSEGFLSSSHFSTLSQPLQQPVDQLQVSHVNSYSMSNSDTFGSGDLYGVLRSSGSMENAVGMNSMSLNPMQRVDASFGGNQTRLQTVENNPLLKPQLLHQFENGNFQSSSNSKENLAQVSQRPLEHRINQQAHHGQYRLQENLLNNDAYCQSQLASNLVSKVKHEPRVEYYNEAFQMQAINKVEPFKTQNQYKQNAVKDEYVGIQSAPVCSSQLKKSPSFPPQTHQMQQISPWNDLSNLSAGMQPVLGLGQLQSSSQNLTQISKNSNEEREHFGLRFPMQHEGTNNSSSVRESTNCQTVAPKGTLEAPHLPEESNALSKHLNGDCGLSYKNQRRWLLFLLHVRKCNATEDNCEGKYCFTAKTLLKHISYCKAPACVYRYCLQTRKLIHHYKHCADEACPVCVFVKNFKEKQKEKFTFLQRAEPSSASLNHGPKESFEHISTSCERDSGAPFVVDDLQPPQKRLKVEKPSQFASPDTQSIPRHYLLVSVKVHFPMGLQEKDRLQSDVCKTARSNVPMNTYSSELEKPVFKATPMGRHSGGSALDGETVCLADQEKPKRMNEISAPKEENAELSVGVVSTSNKRSLTDCDVHTRASRGAYPWSSSVGRPDSPALQVIARLYLTDREKHDEVAREWTLRFAK